MTGACGFPRRKATRADPMIFKKVIAITISNAAIPTSVIWSLVMLLREQPKRCVTRGRGVGPHGRGVFPDFADAIHRMGIDQVREKYGNIFDVYEKITGEDAYKVPMRIYPAPHYTMGGLWVDYHLMSTLPGLFVAGEANFSDHGANRLGASALMQGTLRRVLCYSCYRS